MSVTTNSNDVEVPDERKGDQVAQIKISDLSILDLLENIKQGKVNKESDIFYTVKITDDFMKSVKENIMWRLSSKNNGIEDVSRDGEDIRNQKFVFARDLWKDLMICVTNHGIPFVFHGW